jgi:hypothetical protein
MDAHIHYEPIRRRSGFLQALQIDFEDAIRAHVRYDTPDENGQTRRERNEAFEVESPALEIPEVLRYVWEWYFEASDGMARRVRDGVCERISWAEWQAWEALTGHAPRDHERAILRAIDRAYCAEMNRELSAYRARQAEAQARDTPKPGHYRKGR